VREKDELFKHKGLGAQDDVWIFVICLPNVRLWGDIVRDLPHLGRLL
jgi:hypothetical protein